MKIIYKLAAEGPGVSFRPGDEREVSPEKAARLIAAGVASPASDFEVASVDTPEQAAIRSPKPRARKA